MVYQLQIRDKLWVRMAEKDKRQTKKTQSILIEQNFVFSLFAITS